jgi:hypothetical protein
VDFWSGNPDERDRRDELSRSCAKAAVAKGTHHVHTTYQPNGSIALVPALGKDTTVLTKTGVMSALAAWGSSLVAPSWWIRPTANSAMQSATTHTMAGACAGPETVLTFPNTCSGSNERTLSANGSVTSRKPIQIAMSATAP